MAANRKRSLANWVWIGAIGAAGAALLVATKRSGVLEGARGGQAIQRVRGWLRSWISDRVPDTRTAALPIPNDDAALEIESRIGDQALRPAAQDVSADVRGPVVESEPRSGVVASRH